MSDTDIKHMVDRFLMWRLPENFRPDCGIHFDADAAKKLNPQNARYEPVGTNLLDATQADAMVRFMIDGLPNTRVHPLSAKDAEAVKRLKASRDFLLRTHPENITAADLSALLRLEEGEG
jgi:hypothetical protein